MFQTLISHGHSHNDILYTYSINKAQKFYERIVEKELLNYKIMTLIAGTSARLALAGDKKAMKICAREWKNLLDSFTIKKSSSAGNILKQLFKVVPKMNKEK